MASTSVAEAQRLIAVSLGKIAASRSQRGGINLHRNLLVAGVLHKAKTAYMVENYQQIMAVRKQQQLQQQQQQGAVMASAVSPCVAKPPMTATNSPAPAPAQTVEPKRELSPACHEATLRSGSEADRLASAVQDAQDKENTPPPGSSAPAFPSPAPCGRGEEEKGCGGVAQLGERLSSADNQDYVSGAAPPGCGRCVLKRRSSGESDFDSSSPKKARLGESQESSENVVPWGSSPPCPPAPSPHVESMQVDPPQINNLVHIFNAGFSGLCAAQAASDATDQNCSPSHPRLAGFGARGGRTLDATSLMCGSEAMDNRMDSGPHAIALTV